MTRRIVKRSVLKKLSLWVNLWACLALSRLSLIAYRKEVGSYILILADSARFSARLTSYSAVLIDLLTQADEIGVSAEDRFTVGSLLLANFELSFRQALRTACYSF